MRNSRFLSLRLMFMTAPEGGDPTGGASQQGAGQGGAGDKGGSSGGYTPPATQDELDRIISDRLARERAKYADHDELKAKAAKLDEIEKASASELEKAVQKAKDEGKAEATAAVTQVLVDAAVRAAAAEMHIRRPADAVAVLRAAGKLDAVKVTANEPDAAAIKVVLDDFAKERPDLIEDGKKKQPGVIPGAGSTDAGATEKPAPGMGSLRLGYQQSAAKKTS